MFLFKRRVPEETPKPKVVRYLISAAGVPNYGDEFITRSWLSHLSKVEPESEVWLDCISASHAAHLFFGTHPNLHFTSTAWQLVWDAMGKTGSVEGADELVRMWMRQLGSPREDLGITKLWEATSIHLLGGGYVNGQWPQHTLLADIARAARDHADKRLFATGLGTFPMGDEDAARARAWLGDFDFAEVRDDASAGLLGLAKGLDDAFLCLADESFAWRRAEHPSRLLVCLQQDVVGRHPEAVDAVVASLLASGASPDEPLTLVESVAPEDCWSLEALSSAWQGEVSLMPFMELWGEGLPAHEDAVWVTSRFHMHLLGASAGARGLYLDFENGFYATKHGSLSALGTGWGRLDPARLEASGAPAASANPDFPSLALDLSRAKQMVAASLYGA